MKIDIAGVAIDNITKQETIAAIDNFVRSGRPHYIVTPYSEMIVFAAKDERYWKALNNAALVLPDGIGILWAAKYLALPLKFKNQKSEIKILEIFWQILYSLTRTLISPGYSQSIIQERVVGSHLIWDMAKLAADKGYPLALVGSFDDTATFAALKLKRMYPKLNIRLVLPNREFDQSMVEQINQSNSDILLIAYSPPQQELWLAENIGRINVKVAIGLGGTFDYIAGKRWPAPRSLQALGLEWLWRLITQPWRIKRIWNALPVFVWTVFKYKVHKVESS